MAGTHTGRHVIAPAMRAADQLVAFDGTFAQERALMGATTFIETDLPVHVDGDQLHVVHGQAVGLPRRQVGQRRYGDQRRRNDNLRHDGSLLTGIGTL